MKFATGADFLAWHDKRLAFIGMSGVGKSTLAGYLDSDFWTTFCTDYLLADGPLRPELEAFAGKNFVASAQDITTLSAYVGKLGAEAEGGLGLPAFRRRQALYAEAERKTFETLAQTLASHQGPAIVDAGGSLVEIMAFDGSDPLLDQLTAQVFFVYIEANEDQTRALIDRQLCAPKPMFYRPEFLDQAIHDFVAPLETASPQAFIRFVFPRLVAARKPRYAALSAAGGVRLPLSLANHVRSDAELLHLIADQIDCPT